MLENTLAFAFFAFVASVTPGPNNVLLTATGSRVGFTRGMPTLLGITTGFAFMIFILTLGLGNLILLRPELLLALKVVGVLMLVWLAWQIAFAPIEQSDVAKPGPSGVVDKVDSRPVGMLGAALFQWVNPKAWIVVASAISAHMVPGHSALKQACTFALVFFLAGVVGCIPWLAFGALMQRLLRTERAARYFNYSMGLLLLATVVLIVR